MPLACASGLLWRRNARAENWDPCELCHLSGADRRKRPRLTILSDFNQGLRLHAMVTLHAMACCNKCCAVMACLPAPAGCSGGEVPGEGAARGGRQGAVIAMPGGPGLRLHGGLVHLGSRPPHAVSFLCQACLLHARLRMHAACGMRLHHTTHPECYSRNQCC